MPVLNYHRDDKDLPDMSKLQKCDGCGAVEVGTQMYFAYYTLDQIGVICRPCYAKTYGGPAPVSNLYYCGWCGRHCATNEKRCACGGNSWLVCNVGCAAQHHIHADAAIDTAKPGEPTPGTESIKPAGSQAAPVM